MPSRIAFNKVRTQNKYSEKPKANIKIMLNPRYTGNPKYSNNTIWYETAQRKKTNQSHL